MSNSVKGYGVGWRELPWAQVDVFAEGPLEGNMLAIFTDATGLNDAEMQALARETNLSETTFVLPRSEAEERAEGVRVRIFTTEEELPFAGHPTLGTASWLWMHHPVLRGVEVVRLHLNAGTIPVYFAPGQNAAKAYGEMHQRDPEFGALFSREEVAPALGMLMEDLHPSLAPQVVSTGLPFLIVPLRSVEAAGKLRIDARAMAPLLERGGAKFAYCIAPAGGLAGDRDVQWHARMQWYSGEDPATGSAAGCAISFLVRHGAVESGERTVIEQGVEMRRPSRIMVSARQDGGSVREVRVAGSTICVASGRFILP